MLPILTVSGAPGLLYLNGRFCGETGAAAMPLTRDGVQYLELRPFDPDRRGAVLRLRMEDGQLVEGASGDVFCVQWPSGWIALEIKEGEAEAVFADETEPELLSQLDMPGGRYLLVKEGGAVSFGRDAEEAVFLPARGITDATLRPLPYAGLCAVEGVSGDGKFAAVLRAQDAPEIIKATSGPSARLDGQGVLHAVEAADDLVGHASISVWAPDAQGNYTQRSREIAWKDGGPHWPQSPAETARAWLEALLFGARDEAIGYFSQANTAGEAARAAGSFDAVVDLPPDGSDGVQLGLLSMRGDNLAAVRKFVFTLSLRPGAQGPWKIDAAKEDPCD